MSCILIIVPTLNSSLLLENLINSLKSQINQNWKVLFVDGESSIDHREYIMEKCANNLQFSWIEESKLYKGIFGAMNDGIDYSSSSDWLLFWGSDDIAANKNSIDNLFKEISKPENASIDLLICKARYFNQSTGKLHRNATFLPSNKYGFMDSRDFRKAIFCGLTPPHQSTLISPKARSKNQRYSDSFSLASDLDFFLKLSKNKDLKVKVLDLELVYLGDQGVSGAKPILRLKEVSLAYKRSFGNLYFLPMIFRYLRKLLNKIY